MSRTLDTSWNSFPSFVSLCQAPLSAFALSHCIYCLVVVSLMQLFLKRYCRQGKVQGVWNSEGWRDGKLLEMYCKREESIFN